MLNLFARSLAAEYAPKIRVNVIAPSLTETPLAEKFLNTDEKKEPEIDQEPRGSGLNSKSYLVANDLTGPWKELDDVKPSLLKLARKIKVLFTGDLNKPVVSIYTDGRGMDKATEILQEFSQEIIPLISKHI